MAFVCKKAYFLIGKANPNSYIGNQKFTPVDAWIDKILKCLNDLMSLSMANFTEGTLLSKWNVIKGTYFVLLVLEIVFVVIIMSKVITHKKVDHLSLLLMLASAMSFFAYVLTDMSQPRYITMIPIALTLIFVRNIDWLYGSAKNKKVIMIILIIGACIGLTGKIYEVSRYEQPSDIISNYEVIDFLKEHNLTNGYASFWNSSNMTVLSNELVKIRHIVRQGDNYQPMNWFNKNEWYEEPADFILINNSEKDGGENDMYGISLDGIMSCFGAPNALYEINEYIIMVYDEDISRILIK